MIRRISRAHNHDHRGFTLIELLVVIVILGLLAAVVVFAVRGVGDKGKGAAVATDERIIRTAEEAHCAQLGTYTDGPGLVADKFLSSLPEIHTITAGDNTTQFPLGNCAQTPMHYSLLCKDGSRMPSCGVPGAVQPTAGSDLQAAWSTYFSNAETEAIVFGPGDGSGKNRGPQVALDSGGNVYLTGHVTGGRTYSVPTQAASQPLPTTAFVAKFDLAGRLIYSTYLGNQKSGTWPEDIAVDKIGNAYVVGTNDTDEMSTTPNAYRPVSHTISLGFLPVGQPTNFLTKLDPSGVPVYSTYLWGTNGRSGSGGRDATGDSGGYNDISPAGVALLAPDKVLVTGLDFKLGNPRFDAAARAPCGNESGDVTAGQWRGFLTLMDTSKVGDASHVATTCGGDGKGIGGRAVAVTGATATGGTVYAVGDDPGFSPKGVSKLAVSLRPLASLPPSGAPVFQLVASRPVGSEVPGFALAAMNDGVYVLDHGPTVKRLDADLTPVKDNYPHGGTVLDIAAGQDGTLYEIGYGGADAIRPTANAYQLHYGGDGLPDTNPSDAYLLAVGPTGSDVRYATYLGGRFSGADRSRSGIEQGSSIAINGSDVYLTGVTNSDGFPVTADASQHDRPSHTSGAGDPRDNFDFFVARFRPGPAPGSSTTLLPTIPRP